MGGVARPESLQSWVLPSDEILEWDYEHGDLNKYDKKRKKYLGSFDKDTAKQTRFPRPANNVSKPSKEDFYVVKYSRGFRGEFIRKHKANIELSVLQKIFNVNPAHKDLPVRGMAFRYNIKKQEAEKMQPYLKFDLNLSSCDYQICGGLEFDDKKHTVAATKKFIIMEYQKNNPWKFIEECKLNVSLDFLRGVFRDDQYSSEPSNHGFEPKINLSEQYAIDLQPHVNFKFDLDQYDFWIEKRSENEQRKMDDSEYFIG